MIFQLDQRLANDCYQLAESEHSLLLLLNNRYFPWFIVVPKTQYTELYQLTKEQQELLNGVVIGIEPELAEWFTNALNGSRAKMKELGLQEIHLPPDEAEAEFNRLPSEHRALYC